MKLGEIKLPLECYDQALTIGRKISDIQREGDDLWNMSLSVQKIRGYQGAVELANAALKIYEKTNNLRASTVRDKIKYWKESFN